MELFLQELKRQFTFKRLITYISLSIILALLWIRFIVGGASEGFMQSGCYKQYKGLDAIKVAAKDREPTTGEMTNERFQKGCDIFLKSLRSYDESDVVISNELLQYAVYADSLLTQELSLRVIRGESTEKLANLPKDAGINFYKNEDLYYNYYINKNAHNEKEKSIALSSWSKVKKPYTYYSGFLQWSEGTEHILMFSFVLMIMVGVFSSSIIAKDRETGLDEIILTTQKGRKGLTLAKITLPLLMSFILYLCGVCFYVLLLKLLLPNNALKTSLQVGIITFLPYTYGTVLRNMIVFGLLGILTVASFSTLISSLIKKSSIAMTISTLAIIASLKLEVFTELSSKLLETIKFILPGGASFSYLTFLGLSKFPLTTIMGEVFWIPSLLLIISVFLLLLNSILTSLIYTRR